MAATQTPEEAERQKRICVTVWAYAYEIENAPVVSDATYDVVCEAIEPFQMTGHDVLDAFFLTEFEPHTGLWIHKHPELDKVKACYERVYKKGIDTEEREA